jgi:hypothetical protein
MRGQHRVESGAQPRIGHGQHEAKVAPRACQLGHRGDEDRAEVTDLVRPRTREHGDQRPVLCQAQPAARCGRIGNQRNHRGERMPDIGRRDSCLIVDRLFEREHQQHPVDRACDLHDPFAPPGPDRRADEVHGPDAAGAQLLLESEVEIRRIHPDENRWPQCNGPSLQFAPQAQQPRQVTQDLDIAAHRDFAHMGPGIEPLGDHPVPTDTAAHQRRLTAAQFAHDLRGEQIARRLASDEGHAACSLHQRMMPRCEFCTKSFSRRTASAAAGCSSAIRSSAAIASATVSPSL